MWYWHSFVDPGLPEGSQFLGACITDGDSVSEAIAVAWQAGCNPGGEVMSIQLGEEIPAEIQHFPRYELLSREQISALEAGTVKEQKGNE